MPLFGFIAFIPGLLTVYQMIKKKQISNVELFDTFLYCGACVVFIFLFSTTRIGDVFWGWKDPLPLTIGTIEEEIVKIVFLLLCFKKRLNRYHYLAFGLMFAMMEDLIQLSFVTFSHSIIKAVIYHFHASTLLIFFGMFTLMKKSKVGFIVGMFAAVMTHLFFNLAAYTIFADWKMWFYFSTLFIAQMILMDKADRVLWKKKPKPN